MSDLVKSSCTCCPGYKSRSKIMMSANRFQQFILNKGKKAKLLIKNKKTKMAKEQNEQLSKGNNDHSIELNSLIKKSSQNLKSAHYNQSERYKK